jgi:ribosome-associated protein
VVVLDVRALSPVCDYLVIASGTSKRQMHTVAKDLAEMGDAQNYSPYHISGSESEQWILVDFIHVVAHVFNDESRNFYDLDNLWGDAPRVEWEAKKA